MATEFSQLGPKVIERTQAIGRGHNLQYADLRLIHLQREDLQLKNAAVSALVQTESRGFGLRVLADGCWGFSSHHLFDDKSIEACIEQAFHLAKMAARALAHRKGRVEWTSRKAIRDRWKGACTRDPFQMSLEEKLDTLRLWDRNLRKVPGVTMAQSSMAFRRELKHFFSTEGSDIEQLLYHTGMGYSALATNAFDAQVRSFPNSSGGQFSAVGFELIDEFDFEGETERVGNDAVALLAAPQLPEGVRDIILDGSQLGLQIHESCGHPTELDRVLGWEANYAGRSFLTPDKLETFRYGSPIVNIVGDSTIPKAVGSFAYDDEGSPATRWKLVDQGIFSGFLTSCETASLIGQRDSKGCMRADGWNRMPMVRMVNVSLEPGDWKLQDLLDDSEGAIFLETNRSWSIDQLRYNFQFGTEMAWEIKGGKKGQLYKNGTYQGITPEFWAKCDAICDESSWRVWGVPNCGKGEPGQIMATGHGASPARFRKVQVGMGYQP